MKKLLYTIISLSLVSGTALAKKPFKKHKKNGRPHINNKGMEGKRGAALEERILDQKDTHGADIEAGKDKRPTTIREYHLHTYARIKALLKNGKLTEEQGTKFKTMHTEVTRGIATANEDKTMTTGEIKSLRGHLDQINDQINVIVGDPDAGDKDEERTPLLNKQQHKLEEAIEAGERSGRLSTLEANGLKRKLKRLTDLEDRLKKDEKITNSDRDKLFKEAAELKRDFKKALFD